MRCVRLCRSRRGGRLVRTGRCKWFPHTIATIKTFIGFEGDAVMVLANKCSHTQFPVRRGQSSKSSTASSSTSVGCVPVLCAWRPLRSACLFSALPLIVYVVCVCFFCCALRVRSSRQTTMSLSVSTSHTNSSYCLVSPRFCSGDQRSGVSMWISVWEWKQAFRIVSPDPLPALFLCALRDSSTFEEVNRRSSSTASSSTSVGCVPVLCAWRPLRSVRLRCFAMFTRVRLWVFFCCLPSVQFVLLCIAKILFW